MKKSLLCLSLLASLPVLALEIRPFTTAYMSIRPLHLIKNMKDSPLKEALWGCRNPPMKPTVCSLTDVPSTRLAVHPWCAPDWQIHHQNNQERR